MNDTEFHTRALAALSHMADRLEAAYESGALDELSLEPGVLTIRTADGQTFVISKHAPSQQIWLASPISGGLHFSYDAASQTFRLADGSLLETKLTDDLRKSGVEV